jgi:hypothetical protein
MFFVTHGYGIVLIPAGWSDQESVRIRGTVETSWKRPWYFCVESYSTCNILNIMDLPGSVTVPFPCFNPILLVFAQCQGWFYYYLSDGTLGLLCTNSISPIVLGLVLQVFTTLIYNSRRKQKKLQPNWALVCSSFLDLFKTFPHINGDGNL